MRIRLALPLAAAAALLASGCYTDARRPGDDELTCVDIAQEMDELHEAMHGDWPYAGPIRLNGGPGGLFFPHHHGFGPYRMRDRFHHLDDLFLEGRCEAYCGEIQPTPLACR